jgi:hypothetical protein
VIAAAILVEFVVALFMLHKQNSNMSPVEPAIPLNLKPADRPASA